MGQGHSSNTMTPEEHRKRLGMAQVRRRQEVGPNDQPIGFRPREAINAKSDLKKITVITFLNKKPTDIISIQADLSLTNTLSLMREKSISTCPVYKGRELLGLLSFYDLCDYLLSIRKKNSFEKELLCPVGSLISSIGAGDVVDVMYNDTIIYVVNEMKKQHCHRIYVREYEKGPVVTFGSQLDLIKIIDEEIDILIQNSDITVKEALPYLFDRPLIKCLETENAGSLFEKLLSYKHGAFAVVDDKDVFKGQITLTYLSWLEPSDIHKIDSFIVKDVMKPIYTCGTAKENITIRELIGALARNNYYRMFIVDEESHPVAVVTLTDCLSLICQESGTVTPVN